MATGGSPDPIKNWPEEERPRERLLRYGSASLSEAQLLAIVLRTGVCSRGQSALDLARGLLSLFGGLRGIEQASARELCRVPGIGAAKAAQVKAALEVGKRLLAQEAPAKGGFSSSRDVARRYLPALGGLKKEVFKVLLLNTKNELIRDVTVSEGSLNASLVHPREVFNPAIRDSAAAVLFVHNHPSGDPTPSREDRELTERLEEAGDLVGIRVLDHIIVGDGRYLSFADQGYMRPGDPARRSSRR